MAEGASQLDCAYDPKSNAKFLQRQYWDDRFSEETSYEWLVGFDALRTLLLRYLPAPERCPRLLVVGCGNSSFSADVVSAGFSDLVSIDFSETVIANQRAAFPELQWEVQDMTAMSFADASFDAVLDKAAMDALVTDEGDPWNPNSSTKELVARNVSEVLRVLKDGGQFLQISFQQPHFRKKYLASSEWEDDITVDQVEGGLGYFCYRGVKKS